MRVEKDRCIQDLDACANRITTSVARPGSHDDCRSQDATLPEAHVTARLAEHQVVEHLDPEELSGGREPAGLEGDVLRRRLRVSRRMVVAQKYRGAPTPREDRRLENLPWLCCGRSYVASPLPMRAGCRSRGPATQHNLARPLAARLALALAFIR